MPHDAAQMKELQILEEAKRRMASLDECREKECPRERFWLRGMASASARSILKRGVVIE